MAYRALVRNAIPQGAWRLIREALQPGRPSGSVRCTDQGEAMVRRRIAHRGRGRPARGGGRTLGGNKSVPVLFKARQQLMTDAPNVMRATCDPQVTRVRDGKVWLFAVAEHWNAETSAGMWQRAASGARRSR
jgi:hypothetical protein